MRSFGKVVFLGLSIGLLNPATADDLLRGGRYNDSSSDFPRHITASQNPRARAVAEDGHHSDGGQDRSGRDWTRDVVPSDRERSAAASRSPSPQQWGWNAK